MKMQIWNLFRVRGAGLLFLVGFGALLLMRCGSPKEIVQPIAYNHKVHLTEAGLDCRDCHKGVENSIRATIPSIKVCASCHSKIKGKSTAEAQVVEAVKSGTEIPWQRIYRVPDHVFFSHRRHVTAGKIACKTCHGDVEKLTKPASHQLVPIAMKTCMKCHDNKSISNDCIHCHV
ncbi:MAG: cytochrome c3 family protein [FCB group bacterium]|nr:cytochrome c3 family protein [FCB group bacterium]